MNVVVLNVKSNARELDGIAAEAANAIASYRRSCKLENPQEAIAAVIAFGNALIQGKTLHGGGLHKFGRWVKDSGLDTKPFNHRVVRSEAMNVARISVQDANSFADCKQRNPMAIMKWYREKDHTRNPKITIVKMPTIDIKEQRVRIVRDLMRELNLNIHDLIDARLRAVEIEMGDTS